MVPVRRLDVSCLESPYVLYNIHTSGPCTNACRECHSRSLWETLESDWQPLRGIMCRIDELYKQQLIEGICMLGTDCLDKVQATNLLVQFAHEKGMLSVVYSGYALSAAFSAYGAADFFVCGPYVGGEWSDGKEFYRLDQTSRASYHRITLEEYMTRII